MKKPLTWLRSNGIAKIDDQYLCLGHAITLTFHRSPVVSLIGIMRAERAGIAGNLERVSSEEMHRHLCSIWRPVCKGQHPGYLITHHGEELAALVRFRY